MKVISKLRFSRGFQGLTPTKKFWQVPRTTSSEGAVAHVIGYVVFLIPSCRTTINRMNDLKELPVTFYRCTASLFLSLFVYSTLSFPAQAQQPTEDRWEKTIQAFERKDEQSPPEKGGILFLGSSTVTRWNTDKGFPDLNVINRGFGGTQISDQLKYMDRLVWKYEPQIVVFYCGDNDINAKKTPERVVQDFETFRQRLKERLPDTKLVYLPIKPSLKRWQMWDKMQVVNSEIKKQCENDPNMYYCDIAAIGLNEQGEPRPEFFVQDGLHLSEAGYAAWNKTVREQLDAIR